MKKNQHLVRNWLILFLILIVIAGVSVYLYWQKLFSPLSSDASIKVFVVQTGEGANQIADRLEQEGIIRSSLAFKIARKTKPDAKIEAGDFKLSPNMTIDEVLNTLGSGSLDKWAQLIEGWRVEQMADELNSSIGLDKEAFLKLAKPKEGYLFPDKYLLNPNASVEDVVSILENTFDKRYDEELQSKVKAQGLTPQQGVILASLVEREARTPQVRTEVAGIMLKRLKMGMKLDIDATVQYAKDSQVLAKGGTLDKYWKPILLADYQEVRSPYNTYLNSGLPPAPICNPSLSALTAVANADPKTPYVYYFHDSEGNTYYAKTLEEHNQNIADHR